MAPDGVGGSLPITWTDAGAWVGVEDDGEAIFRLSSVKSFFETEVLNLNRLEPNNLDKKFPSWSFCLCFELFLLTKSSLEAMSRIVSAFGLTSLNILSRLLDLSLAFGDENSDRRDSVVEADGFSSITGSCKNIEC